MSTIQKTSFLPAERSSRKQIESSTARFRKPLMVSILDAIPAMVVILDGNRQIVLANRAVIALAHAKEIDSVFGLRPGELLRCVHAIESDGGCGTTEFCSQCGAAQAIVSSQSGFPDVQEYRINAEHGEALDLRVWTSPIEVNGIPYVIFSVLDITDEKRRRLLERVFFHDVMNSLASIQSAAELLSDAPAAQKDELTDIIFQSTKRVIGEVSLQRELTAAETGELKPKIETISSSKLVGEIVALYRKHPLAADRRIEIQRNVKDISFSSDAVLVSRVISNMVKNALEATPPGGVITVGYLVQGKNILFQVHNATVMPPEVQTQVFQRSFTTKGRGRGIGTYGMRLLTERYLNGSVSFISSESKGTTFTASYPINWPTTETTTLRPAFVEK